MTPSWIPCTALAVAAGAGGLAITNPGPEEFQAFAGERLVNTITREICAEKALPLALRLVLQNCPELVASQRQVLGRIALQHSHRTNLGLASVYRTELGGQRLLPDLQLPRYQATTLAGAGQFVVVNTAETPQP
ncbi:MAG: DUF4359 domain-containing protein [Cyanobacteriota bacterium]|nr:DUF4359 domain-containing protein [Cyanobacteriota bacterium]